MLLRWLLRIKNSKEINLYKKWCPLFQDISFKEQCKKIFKNYSYKVSLGDRKVVGFDTNRNSLNVLMYDINYQVKIDASTNIFSLYLRKIKVTEIKIMDEVRFDVPLDGKSIRASTIYDDSVP